MIHFADLLPGTHKTQTSSGATRPTIRASDVRELVEPLEKLILQYPAAALASAFIVGVTLAWWIKRR
jgi:hypothetical protein